MVIPEIGFEDVPISPVIRDDTVAKKKPKIRMRMAATRVAVGWQARRHRQKHGEQHDPPMTHRHRNVALGSQPRGPPLPAERSRRLSRAEEMMVGIVRPSVIRPDASTAPAPM